jgi:hypothetical protein
MLRTSRSAVHGEFLTGGPKSRDLGGAPGLLELVQGASLHPKGPMQGFGEHLADIGVGPLLGNSINYQVRPSSFGAQNIFTCVRFPAQ